MNGMEPLRYVDRITQEVHEEKIYGGRALKILYGDDAVSRIFGHTLLHRLIKYPFFAEIYGWWQSVPVTKMKVSRFIRKYHVDESDFVKPTHRFRSFNDFFYRKLKPEARPIAPGSDVAIMPADGRYRIYPNLDNVDRINVKGHDFSISTLLDDEELASRYQHGSMVMARLCPADYHRFHFPCSGTPSEAKVINGWLYSVNPIAFQKNIDVFTENKRVITELQTQQFGTVAIVEVGATNVGSIIQTYSPDAKYEKGEEKGYFAFGGSAIVLLFEPEKIAFDKDLLDLSSKEMEIRCLMGQSLGTATTEASAKRD